MSSSIRPTRREVQLIVDQAVAADAVLIPFGGGSNISGSLQPRRMRPARSSRSILVG